MFMLLLATLLACSSTNDGATPDDTGGRAEIAPGVWALDGLDEDLPPDDLAPFFDAVGDAQFVGLGETIHASGGFQQAKFRLFKALVEEKGFRAVGYESPWDDILVAQEYVRTCEGSLDEALTQYIWIWEDIALRDMLEWMCAWNQEHVDDPVTMWGWDIQQPWDDGPRLETFFEEAAPADAATLGDAISTCLGVDSGDWQTFFSSAEGDEFYNGVDGEDHAACMTGLEAVGSYFETHEAELVAATSEDALAWARVSLVGLRGWQREAYNYSTDCNAGYEARDIANAYVLQEIHRLSFPEAKSVIWAHNAHLGFDTASLTGRYGDPEGEADVGGCEGTWEGMGTLLQEELGDAYRPFALTGYDVHIGWDGWDEPRVIPFDPRSTELMLHDLGAGDAFVDLTVEDSLFDDQPYELGSWWSVLRDQFAGVVYLETSWAMDWPLEDPYNAGCADDEVRIDGTVTAYDAEDVPGAGAGASVCALDGPCTTTGSRGSYSLCVPAYTNAALTYDLDGYCPQVVLLSPGDLGLLRDVSLYADAGNAELYGAAGFAYPAAPGTGNASGYVYDANYEFLAGATITISPASGAGVVYFDADNQPYSPEEGSTTDFWWFLAGEMAAGWYDVTIEHPDANRCRLTTGNYTSEGATLHVPIVDGFETYLWIQCTP